MRPQDIPNPTAQRLSLYLRELEAFLREGRKTISSRQLGEALRLTDAQVRKDLAYFGQFGQPGVGYDVPRLMDQLRSILGTDRPWNVLLVGAGNLGRALMAYRGFGKKGFHIVAVFDNHPDKVGKAVLTLDGVRIQPLEQLPETVRDKGIQLGILAVPAENAQFVADRMVCAGIRGILNFAPVSLRVPSHVAVRDVDLSLALEQLSFRVSLLESAEQEEPQSP